MLKRLENKLNPNPRRVILRFFLLPEERIKKILSRIFNLEEDEIQKLLVQVFNEFSSRHKNFEKKILNNYKKIEGFIENRVGLSRDRKLLIGSYFSNEYSVESAALFNPSIVPHPDQEGVQKDSLRFILSLRATGEGHISSIEFREGIIDPEGNIDLIHKSDFTETAEKIEFKNSESSNYSVQFSDTSILEERILFPVSESEKMGMEDARFVKFTGNDQYVYYATYTAYDGRAIRSQLISTKDFKLFEVNSLQGTGIKDKGMALFPRKIKNKYIMTSRQDGENLYLMKSDDILKWNDPVKIKVPELPWEFIQLGNCGSPIETSEGWILLTHSVGPIRKYVISALLLDLENPEKVLGYLEKPLIEADKNEREGYVPNVVYSCGSLIHLNNLIIPYAMSDSACGFTKIKVEDLLNMFIINN